MNCKICNSDSNIRFCDSCIQKTDWLIRYPVLETILEPETLEFVRSNPTNPDVKAICQICKKLIPINLHNLLVRLRKNEEKSQNFTYRCLRCSKIGKTDVSIDTLMHLIDFDKTNELYGGIPKNVKNGKVVIKCEDCNQDQHVILGNALHQARRHKMAGRTCLYKCFNCGIKRPDAIEKSANSNTSILLGKERSSLEKAMANRLDSLRIKYEEQFQTDMYVWDFYLPEYSLLIDVNGEYWHSLPKNAAKDSAKFTYTEKYHPEFKTLSIEEKYFLNPKSVEILILKNIGFQSEPIEIDFDLKDVKISVGYSIESIDFLNSYHYSGAGRKSKITYSAHLGSTLIAVCKFSHVGRLEMVSSLKLKTTEVLELDRFCIHPSYHKKNFASWFISRSYKHVFKTNPKIHGLVSFADESFGHFGTIYKASNWKFDGKTRDSYHYMNELGVVINKKRVWDIASKLKMKEKEYAEKHGLTCFKEKPKLKFIRMRLFISDYPIIPSIFLFQTSKFSQGPFSFGLCEQLKSSHGPDGHTS